MAEPRIFSERGLSDHVSQVNTTHDWYRPRIRNLVQASVASTLREVPVRRLAETALDEGNFPKELFENEILPTFSAKFQEELGEQITNVAQAGFKHEMIWAKSLGLEPKDYLQVRRRYESDLLPWSNNYAKLLTQGKSEGIIKGVQRAVADGILRGIVGRELATTIEDTFGLDARNTRAVLNYRKSLRAQKKAPFLVAKFARAYAKRLRDSQDDTFARTAITTAMNFGRVAMMEELVEQGALIDVEKMWVTQEDELVCPVCKPLDGVRIALDSFFSLASGAIAAPPAHPNCRCLVVPKGGEVKSKRKLKQAVSKRGGHNDLVKTELKKRRANNDQSRPGRKYPHLEVTIEQLDKKSPATDKYWSTTDEAWGVGLDRS